MNTKRYLIGSLAVFVILFLLEFVLHAVLLADQYLEIEHIFRPAASQSTYFPAMIIGYLIMAFGFGYIFIKGYEGKGTAEGAKFGLLVGVTFGTAGAMIQYSLFPYTGWMMLTYFFAYPLEMIIAGVIFAGIYDLKK